VNTFMPLIRVPRATIAWFLLLLYLPACTSWHVGIPTPAEFVETEQPERVRVTRTDGSTFMLRSPVVRGDTLVGTVGGGGLVREDTVLTVRLLLSDVRSVAVGRKSAGNTLLVVGFVLGVLTLLSCAGDDPYWGC